MENRLFKTRVAFLIGRVGPVGLIPVAPGTMGAIVGAVMAIFSWRLGFPFYFAILSIVVFAGTWAAEIIEKETKIHDDRKVVIDEVAGMMLTLSLWENPGLLVTIIAFFLFRFFDILKPWPISVIDRRVGGGFGCMADDIAAGFLCLLVLMVLHTFWDGK